MALFNELEGLLRKVYVPQEGKSIMLMYINDIPEPYSSKMNTIWGSLQFNPVDLKNFLKILKFSGAGRAIQYKFTERKYKY